jgi:hypothetical protein
MVSQFYYFVPCFLPHLPTPHTHNDSEKPLVNKDVISDSLAFMLVEIICKKYEGGK